MTTDVRQSQDPPRPGGDPAPRIPSSAHHRKIPASFALQAKLELPRLSSDERQWRRTGDSDCAEVAEDSTELILRARPGNRTEHRRVASGAGNTPSVGARSDALQSFPAPLEGRSYLLKLRQGRRPARAPT